MVSMDEFVNIMRRVAAEAVGRMQFKGTGVCTAYNPKTHAVKVMLQPHNVESGWIPVSAVHVGNGCGILCGPTVGSADKLDGTVFDIHMDGGDPDTIVAHHRHFSTQEPPPEVQAGEILFMHASGARSYYDAQGNLTHSLTNGATSQLKANGDVIHTPGNGGTVYHGGDPANGGTFAAVMTEQGPSSNVKAKIG